VYTRLARWEEKEAINEFGQEYIQYALTTPAFLPRLGGKKATSGA